MNFSISDLINNFSIPQLSSGITEVVEPNKRSIPGLSKKQDEDSYHYPLAKIGGAGISAGLTAVAIGIAGSLPSTKLVLGCAAIGGFAAGYLIGDLGTHSNTLSLAFGALFAANLVFICSMSMPPVLMVETAVNLMVGGAFISGASLIPLAIDAVKYIKAFK